MQSQERRSRKEESAGEESSDIKEDIKKMMSQTQTGHAQKVPAREEPPSEAEVSEVIRLMKALAFQYDEIEGYLKSVAERTEEMKTETFPVELIGSLVQATTLSPSLVKIMASLSEENKALRKTNEDAKTEGEKAKAQLQSLGASEQSKKLEMKYLHQTVSDATKELRAFREDAQQQRKRIIELEAALEAQKKITKELLREKTVVQKSTDIHEEEKKLLKRLIDEKDEVAEALQRKNEELEYESKACKRELTLLNIQYMRMCKRADLKDKALSMCNAEMERLISQLDRLTRMDTQKKERLEYLKIIKKRLENENKDLLGRASLSRPKREVFPQDTLPQTIEPLSSDDFERAEFSPAGQRGERYVEDASVSAEDSESISGSGNRTTTSFKEMQKKSDEITRKFAELENLLQEIKKGNEVDMDTVEDRISQSTSPSAKSTRNP
ncbi:hypothetical protein NECID01_0092 [Nematocida sp. AWRm77]|nr:hypothetical protein NECID01_0092 [Nematocida sp. AWRm77]